MERQRIAGTHCDDRRADGVCNARGCTNGIKTVKCSTLAQMETQDCPRGIFGDKKRAIAKEISAAVQLGD